MIRPQRIALSSLQALGLGADARLRRVARAHLPYLGWHGANKFIV